MVHYYSVIKCTPCRKRCETINIGLVLFDECDLQIHLAVDTQKFAIFDNGFVRDELSDLCERWSFFSRGQESAEEKHASIKSSERFGVWIGGLGFFTAEGVVARNKKIQELMSLLVI